MYRSFFLDASNTALIKRYKETRRSHPLAGKGRLETGIEKERARVAFLKKESDFIIDTSMLLTKELRQELEKIFLKEESFKICLLPLCPLALSMVFLRMQIWSLMCVSSRTLTMWRSCVPDRRKPVCERLCDAGEYSRDVYREAE